MRKTVPAILEVDGEDNSFVSSVNHIGTGGAVRFTRKETGLVKTSKLALVLTLICAAAIPAAAQVNDTYVIPATANLEGGFGTRWMTRFTIFNPHLDYSLVVSITYIPTGGLTGDEALIQIPPNALAYSNNLLDDLFGVSGGGSLLVATFPEDNPGVPNNVLARSFLVNSDTFNDSPDGTYGQTIPGTWTGLFDYDSDGISAVAHGIRNISSLGWRTNVGALNLGRCQVNLLINVYDADGNTLLRELNLKLPPLGHLQDRLPITVNNGTVEFFVDDPCAADDNLYAVVFPYVSTIDQYSGDPAYQSPALLASPSILFAKGKSIEPTSFGKKIGVDYARHVRAAANHRGLVPLRKTDQGWGIVK